VKFKHQHALLASTLQAAIVLIVRILALLVLLPLPAHPAQQVQARQCIYTKITVIHPALQELCRMEFSVKNAHLLAKSAQFQLVLASHVKPQNICMAGLV
jgi:uncharacterized membrane protein YhfC